MPRYLNQGLVMGLPSAEVFSLCCHGWASFQLEWSCLETNLIKDFVVELAFAEWQLVWHSAKLCEPHCRNKVLVMDLLSGEVFSLRDLS